MSIELCLCTIKCIHYQINLNTLSGAGAEKEVQRACKIDPKPPPEPKPGGGGTKIQYSKSGAARIDQRNIVRKRELTRRDREREDRMRRMATVRFTHTSSSSVAISEPTKTISAPRNTISDPMSPSSEPKVDAKESFHFRQIRQEIRMRKQKEYLREKYLGAGKSIAKNQRSESRSPVVHRKVYFKRKSIDSKKSKFKMKKRAKRNRRKHLLSFGAEEDLEESLPTRDPSESISRESRGELADQRPLGVDIQRISRRACRPETPRNRY
ncbi:hypothetical protein AAMO2058_001567000 [Amorphochlora amoebiformis]